MPIGIKVLASEGTTYGAPFFGQALATDVVLLDISDLTADYEVDDNNMVVPGLP